MYFVGRTAVVQTLPTGQSVAWALGTDRAVTATSTISFVRDPLSFEVPIETLLSKDYAKTLARLIDGSWPLGQPARRVRILDARAKRAESELCAYRDSERVARTLGLDRFEAGLEVRTLRHE